MSGSDFDRIAAEFSTIKSTIEIEAKLQSLGLPTEDSLKIAAILCQRDAFDVAAEIYLTVLRSFPEQQDAYLQLAHRIHSDDAGATELRVGTRLLGLRPNDRAIRFSIARIYDRSGAPQSAFEVLATHVDLSTYPPYLALFVDLAARLDKHDQGRPTAERLTAILEQKLRSVPNDPESRTELARVQTAYKSAASDVVRIETALAAKLSSQITIAAEGMCTSLNDANSAAFARHVETLSSLQPITPMWINVLERSRIAQLVDAAARATRAGWHTDSDLLFRIIEETADFAVSDVQTPDFLVRAGHPIEAERWILRALASPTTHAGTMLLAYAEILMSQERTKLAARIAEIACSHDGLDPETLKRVAHIAQLKGLEQIATAFLERAITIAPLDRIARYSLALIVRSTRGANAAYRVLQPTIRASTFPAAIALFIDAAIVSGRFTAAREAMNQLDSLPATAAVLPESNQVTLLAARIILNLREGREPPSADALPKTLAQLLRHSQRELARLLCDTLTDSGRLLYDILDVADDLLTIGQKIEILTKDLANERDKRGSVLNALGRLHLARLDLAKAIDCFQRARGENADAATDPDLIRTFALSGRDGLIPNDLAAFSLDTPGLTPSMKSMARLDRRSDARPAQGGLVHRPFPRRRLFDCCVLTNEIAALEIRFAELSDAVDLFVVVEAAFTSDFSPKSLTFEANRARFRKYESKIRYISLEQITGPGRYDLRTYMRNIAVASLHDVAHARDVVVVSDADEIPRVSAIDEFLYKRQAGFTKLRLQTFKHFYNYRVIRRSEALYAFIGRYDEWRNAKPAFGDLGTDATLDDQCDHVVDDAGWAFLGVCSPTESIVSTKEKSANSRVLRDFLREFSTAEAIERTRDALRQGTDTGTRACAVEVDTTFPRLMRREPQLFESMILPLREKDLSRLLVLMEADRWMMSDEIELGVPR